MPTVESYKQGVPCWVDLATSDVSGAIEFYGGLFGWRFDAYPMGPEQGGITYYMSTINGGNVAGLIELMPGMDQATAWNTYIAVDDADAAAQRAVDAGGTVLMAPDEIPGSGRSALVQDPEGARISLWQQKGHIGSSVVNESGSVVWNELHVADVTHVLPFYTAVFGVEPSHPQSNTAAMGDAGDYVEFAVDGRNIAGAVPNAAPDARPGWFVYFAVDDTDAAVARATALGATISSPPVDMVGVGRWAGIVDPQGAEFYVIKG